MGSLIEKEDKELGREGEGVASTKINEINESLASSSSLVHLLPEKYSIQNFLTTSKKPGSRRIVASALNTEFNNEPVIIKMGISKKTKACLATEYINFKTLAVSSLKSRIILPQLLEHSIGQGNAAYLVFLNEGTSLDKWHFENAQTITASVLATIAVKVLEALENLHNLGYIHGDIHPGNVLIDWDRDRFNFKLVLIDFKNLQKVISNEIHVQKTEVKVHTNSYKSFCTANLEMTNMSRKHDLEMFSFMLRDLNYLTLPWHLKKAVKKGNTEVRRRYMRHYRFNPLYKEKVSKKLEKILLVPDLRKVFKEFVRYCHKITFYEDPLYKVWIEKFTRYC